MTDHQIGELYEHYHKYLITVIHNRLFEGCPPDYAYDCLDDVFTIALEKKDDEKFNKDPAGWLIVTAQHVVDNFNRKQTTRLRYHDSNFNFDINHIVTSDSMLEDLALKMALEQKVWDKVYDGLSSDDRVLFIMKYLQEKTTEDISRELFLPKAMVLVKVTRLKGRVKKLIKKFVGA